MEYFNCINCDSSVRRHIVYHTQYKFSCEIIILLTINTYIKRLVGTTLKTQIDYSSWQDL